jgi:hypothetical protein
MIAASRRCLPALLFLALAAGPAAAAVVAQQHRPIDPARSRAAPGALTSLGGPKTSGAGPHFPVVPAGALAAHPVATPAHHPAASLAPHTLAAPRSPPKNPAFHPAASAHAPLAGSIHRPAATPAAPVGPPPEPPAPAAAPAPAPAP